MQLLGHRGQIDPAGPPENTIAAIEAALAGGADGVEVDVRVTADGIAVCVHDADLRRVAWCGRQVATTSYATLAEIPLPGWQHIPRLDDVVQAMRGRGLLVLDLKLGPGSSAALVTAVMTALGRAAASDVVVSSESGHVLDALREAQPRLRTALITGPHVPAVAALHRAVVDDHHDVHPHVRALLADHGVAERAAALRKTIRCWTVNRGIDARLLAIAGVPSVITDDPRRLRAALDGSAPTDVARSATARGPASTRAASFAGR